MVIGLDKKREGKTLAPEREQIVKNYFI